MEFINFLDCAEQQFSPSLIELSSTKDIRPGTADETKQVIMKVKERIIELELTNQELKKYSEVVN